MLQYNHRLAESGTFSMPRLVARIALLLVAWLALSACTAMLLGGGSGKESAPAERRSAASVARDDSISGQVRRALQADTELGRYTIGVGTASGVVTLSGTVGSYRARDRAVQIARDTAGVQRVENRLVVNTNI